MSWGGGHLSCSARGYGGALEAPPSGSGADHQKPALFALENPPKLRNESIITDPAFIFSSQSGMSRGPTIGSRRGA